MCFVASYLGAQTPRPVPGGRITAISPVASSRTGFSKISPEISGLAFTNRLEEQSAANNRILENGSGVALGDVDGDGLCDIYLCRLEGPNVLYRNLGNWRFTNMPSASGAACESQHSTGAVFADVDGDRDLDLLVNGLGTGTRLFLNDSTGRFTESTNNRLSKRYGATSLALADIDGDGDLDLYVPNYRTTTFKDNPPGLRIEARQLPDGRVQVTPEDRFLPMGTRGGSAEIIEKGERDFLYLNLGGGNFAPVSWTQGTFLDEDGKTLASPPTDWGLSAMFHDLNGDGWPDLYVCNDFVYWPDRVWLNRQGAGFQAAPRTWLRNQSLSSMSVDVADINRDGLDDLFVAEMLGRNLARRAWQRPNTMAATLNPPVFDPGFRPEVTRNTLHVARPGGPFAEIAQFAGLAATDWTWSAVFLDVDLDGWEDLLVANGNNHDVQHADVLAAQAQLREVPSPAQRLKNLSQFPRLHTPNLAFRNRRDLTFEETGEAWGFNETGVTTALALADLDNDGDLDVVANNLNGAASLYRNESAAPRVAVRLKGAGENTRGIGARIIVRGGPVTQSQEIICGGRYLSGDDSIRVFAASQDQTAVVEVHWPGGRRSEIKDVPPNSIVEVDETSSIETQQVAKPTPQGLFEDVSTQLGHKHSTDPFDDFARQPLLPRKLSTEGPGVGFFDLDSDGFEDLIIGGNGELAVFQNDQGRGFKPWNGAGWKPSFARMIGGLAAAQTMAGAVIVAGESNWRDGQPSAPAGSVIAPGKTQALPDSPQSSGAVVLADFDGDGRLDLAIGGRAVPGRWPQAADIRIFRGTTNGFEPLQTLSKSGLVTGIIASDLDGDGRPEIAAATEFGPIRLFRWNGNQFSSWTPEISVAGHGRVVSLATLSGCWSGITAADVDEDGRLDLVVGNRGLNFGDARLSSAQAEVAVVFGEFASGGDMVSIVHSHDPVQNLRLPWRDFMSVRAALPFTVETVSSHEAHGRTGVESLLGGYAAKAERVAATWFASSVFLNRSDRFELRALPAEAQWSSAFGVTAADFDGDGHQDVFLAQNFFGVDAETSREDAGLGLLLLGDGNGYFRTQSPEASGVAIVGEGRGTAAGDFNNDGRTDLVVGQHGRETVLLRNRLGNLGLPVRLKMPGANPGAIGAVVRADFGTRMGPAMEIHAGCGWWSQDSQKLLITGPTKPVAIQVRWPGGTERRYLWPSEATELHPEFHP
jgi:hypothetical protein